MKRILYIQDTFCMGGINTVESAKENYLAEKGYSIYNLNVLNKPNKMVEALYSNKIHKLYIQQEKLDSLYQIPILGRSLRFFYFRIKLIQNILSIDPDIIVVIRDTLEPFSVVLLTFWKKRIQEFHGSLLPEVFDHYSFSERLRYKIKYRFYTLQALTQRDAQTRNKLTGRKYTSIPNPMYFQPSRFSTQDNHRILILARLSPEKGLSDLLDKWDLIQMKHPDWVLDIYGEGEEKEKLEYIIKEKKLETVSIHPFTNNTKEIIPEYSIFLLPSMTEGFPMVALESMSCGVPLVAYDCPCGPSEAISDGVDGILVPLGDMKTFIDKVNYLIEHPDVRKSMSLTCRENIKRFELDKVMAKWEYLFDNI